jgi:deazaflavin-dependent oxidoreductase (nitroreductase family)
MLRRFTVFNVFVYQISGGRIMGMRNGLPLLLLTTTGRSSGNPHTVPLAYLEDDGRYVVMPGVYQRPDWYLNLKANGHAQAQIKNHQFDVFAEEVDGVERERLWKSVPQYWRDYQEQYSELLPLILIKRSS